MSTSRGPPVCIFEPHDVVLAEIASRLHFDQMQRDRTRVLETVFGAKRNERRFVFVEEEDVLVAGHFRSARDDNPMLCAVVMHLKRKLRARIDDDALHLEALARIDGIIRTPGTEHLTVMHVMMTARAF